MPPAPFFDLVNGLESLNVNKYGRFEIINTSYKSLRGGQQITADVLIPKSLLGTVKLTSRPVIVRVHGGFLVTGSSLYPPWFSTWILDYAETHGAVIISPDYRLLPEVSGRDIMEDINDFWKWFCSGSVERALHTSAFKDITLNYDQVLVVGESAGGYLAVQLGLSYPDYIRGIIAAYPMLDLRVPFCTESYEKPIVGVPNIPNHIVDDHLASMPRNGPVMAANPPDRLELAFAIVQNGRFLEAFGQERTLFPLERLEDLAAAGSLRLPTIFIFHGEQDSAVPVDGSRRFVQSLRDKATHVKTRLHVQDGDHGFDVDATLDTPWLREGLDMISSDWVRPRPIASSL